MYNKIEINTIRRDCMDMLKEGKTFLDCREYVLECGLTFTAQIAKEAFFEALKLRELLFNPDDYGINGKLSETEENLQLWAENEHIYSLPWRCFFTKAHGRTDIETNGERYEKKTGAGDWLYSKRFSEWNAIINEYKRKTSYIIWETDSFRIVATWTDFLNYLESYNEKGLTTWFKSCIKYSMYGACLQMQEFKTSKRKLSYLESCPWNEWG